MQKISGDVLIVHMVQDVLVKVVSLAYSSEEKMSKVTVY